MGFITFVTQQSAENALEQNGKDLGGRGLGANMATDQPLNRDGGYRGGGNR